ncbi:MAG: helix-turn-helix domain-containing protein [Clostridia bacterium]|nr:helix-turn-helix domain-containing protein [Clostridia bacterium]MBR5245122.1 helix-turn-helix domain-containing protein [Clostridia bacterium]
MAARLFQSILLEIKNKIPFILGIVDATGNIISCTELRFIGENVEAAEEFFASGMDEGECGGYTFRKLDGYDNGAEYAVFAGQSGENAAIACNITAVAINNSKSLYDEKHDKATFIKKIILDNILPGDIYIKSREMQFQNESKRVVYLIHMEQKQDVAVVEMLHKIFPDRQRDFAITINETEVVLVKELRTNDVKEINKYGKQIDAGVSEAGIDHVVGIGSVANQLKDIARSFKEAQVAVEIGRVFDENITMMSYENLGIGRLIYQLPTTLCEMFLSEVFKKGSVDSLDEETLFTIQKFFENNLNVSETSRKLFVHRNTLVYRLEKIKKLTGLDLREFDNAIVLKVALMVKQYLRSRENFN